MTKVVIPKFKLNNGLEIPALGYGTWTGLNEKDEFISEDIPKLVDAMSYAIDVGYRHIDTAHLYRVEPEVGYVVNKKIKEGVIKREDIFVTTKVWNDHHRPEDVERSVRGSLKRLGLDYVDLVLMHWPMSVSKDGVDEKIDYLDTWRGFESVLKQGLVKSIGVSNFNVEQLIRLLANCNVLPVVNQVEINLNLGQKELVDFCQKNGIQVVAYTPFGRMVPSRFDPNYPAVRHDDPVMLGLGKKYGKTVQQIALRYLYQRGITSIPKTLTKTRIVENASIFDFELDENDVATLQKFDNNFRTVRPTFWQNMTNYPFDKVDVAIPEIPVSLRIWKNGANLDID
ncbi:aldo-keto reductase AKR2E4-like [Melitaea cinxia]|uniref:aldo-keto reductase AKR2E4-like n=1 Tax=Melitaea cinxia TaxID=113334 RepID=UPI001E273217|nr:aldo-keto reductase AKR2E4-like [Melitaea cinxia]